jgi:hypothetical protein
MPRGPRTIALAVVSLLASAPIPAFAQDAHYWTNHYGTRGELLTGLIVGSIEDLSSTFYNPGAIALIGDRRILLTAPTFEISQISARNAAGQGIDLKDTRAGTGPGMFAVSFPGEERRHAFAVSFLTRTDFVTDSKGRGGTSATGGTFAGALGGEIAFLQRLSDNWGGFTWSYSRDPRFGVGITQYIALRSQTMRTQVFAQAVPDSGRAASAIFVDEISYWNVRALWKAGVAVDLRPWAFGLAVTTPSLDLLGDGSTYLHGSFIQPDSAGTAGLASNYQKDLRARWKSPFSIAGGLSYQWMNTKIHLGAEYFAAVGPFTVLDAADFQSQTSDSTFSARVSQELSSVFNWGVGIEHRFNTVLKVYAGAVVDKSAYVSADRSQLSVTSWDIVHLNVGVELISSLADLTLGLAYGRGSDTSDRLGEYLGGSEILEPAGVPELQYQRLKFLIGVTFGGQSAQSAEG